MIANVREIDGWNLRSFSGLNLGWQLGFDWLKKSYQRLTDNSFQLLLKLL